MLILTRKASEKIIIDGGITITVVRIQGNSVRLGFEAPRTTNVLRAELPPASPPGPPADEPSACSAAVLQREALCNAAHAACDEPAPVPRPVLSLQAWRARRRSQRLASAPR